MEIVITVECCVAGHGIPTFCYSENIDWTYAHDMCMTQYGFMIQVSMLIGEKVTLTFLGLNAHCFAAKELVQVGDFGEADSSLQGSTSRLVTCRIRIKVEVSITMDP